MDNLELFTKLYEEVYLDLYHFALYTLRNRQDAEDVVQDCVTSAYEQFTRLRNIESFRPWIFKILTNQCKRKLKQYYRQPTILEETSATTEHRFEENADLKTALIKLSDEDRLIVLLSIYAGYNSKEIAWILKKNPNTIRSRLSRAIQKLKIYIKE